MLLFVYGTMKRDGRNWPRLWMERAVFIGEFTTDDQFDMFIRDPDGVPLAVHNPAGSSIAGDLFAILDDSIDLIDQFEGHPRVYERQPVTLQGFNDLNDLVVYMYVYKQPIGKIDDPVTPRDGVLTYHPYAV
jgi:gamma-glutamylcyclotransferase (GGCT)/AIG2-like uncharacterized protein YtfP